jgi:phage shock protein E
MEETTDIASSSAERSGRSAERGRVTRLLAAAGAVALLGAGFTACGDDPDPDPAEVTRLAPTTAPPATTDEGDPAITDDEVDPDQLREELDEGADQTGEEQGEGLPTGVPVDSTGGVTAIDSGEAKALRAAKPHTVLIDVRTPEEYIGRHVIGAQNIDVENEGLWTRRVDALDRDRPTVVYCRTGRRSAEAAQKLVQLGFTEVYDLGGIGDFREGDLPLDR